MTRPYEIAYLLKEGGSVDATKKRIREYIDQNSVTFSSDSDMGTRKLAYEIFKNRETITKAFYYFTKVEADPKSLPEFERLLKYDEDIIRYMINREE